MAQLITRTELLILNSVLNTAPIAGMLEITRQAVESRFQRMGVSPIRHKITLTSEILFLQQFPVKIIAHKLNIGRQRVYDELRKANIKPARSKPAQELLPDVFELGKLLSKGYTYSLIGLRYEVSGMTVWRKVNHCG